MTVNIRETRWTDLAELARLETELFGADAWSEATWWSELAGRPRRAYLTAENLGHTSSVGHTGHTEPARPTGYTAHIAHTRHTGQVDHAGRILGYAGLDRGGSVADVMTIAVAPAARGTGLGRRLLTALLDLAGEAEAVMLEVRADNDAARSLYASAGFELVSTRRRYYGAVDALVLRALRSRPAPASAGAAPPTVGIPSARPGATTQEGTP